VDPNTGYFVYPAYAPFIVLLQSHFRETNQIQVANNQLATIKQGKKSVEDFIAEFRLLLSRAGMTTNTPSDHLHLINYFRRGLNQAIARKIALSDNVPDTIEGWADRAIQYDTNYRLNQAIFGTTERRENRTSSPRQKDPNAMDLDVLTTDERTRLMKIGACFRCRKTGHLSRDCPNSYQNKKEVPKPAETKKWKGKEMAAHIRTLLASMDEEEKDEFFKTTAEEGF